MQKNQNMDKGAGALNAGCSDAYGQKKRFSNQGDERDEKIFGIAASKH